MSDKRIQHEVLDYFFRPQSVAVIGVSPGTDETRFGGQYFLRSLMKAGYAGRLYAVGLGSGTYKGKNIYPDIITVPDEIDYAIVAVPAKFTPDILKDCIHKKVKAVHFFSAGFSELGGESEANLQKELTDLARKSGIRFIGPNCMGIYHPKMGLTFNPDFPSESGVLSIISQSGGNSEYAIRMGMKRGIYFSKVISFGNGADVNETDLLEYLARDDDTGVIAMYLEGVRDGSRFLKTLRGASKIKPVVVYKGGITETGKNAALSHTGAIAGSADVWNAVLKQAKAIEVSNIDEIIDIALLFKHTKPPKGRNIAIIGIGGGNSVLVADMFSSAKLNTHLFSTRTRETLRQLLVTETGASYRNPVDLYGWSVVNSLRKVIEVIVENETVENIVIHLPVGFVNAVNPGAIESCAESLMSLPAEIKQRTIVVLLAIFSLKDTEIVLDLEKKFAKSGLPVFTSAGQAARALSRFIGYYEGNKS
jgi:acetate---CoA ligase (ADP-forming)